ncbi:glycerol-3-phosphate acyltransferase [Chlamydia trachomatis]|uniref:1-acyl-sn-glycerol-3-phosphate acyltransferase n=1 Tax=Chlamydia trachomatis TaxID=813 RepID=UPI0007DCC69E|nr:1-acyl-sn-glycerol-3-phosphate acyltransferase [Chlamydia trachomatis]ANI66010.1 glycerol-3-phosphate acyltransferase [Chlamydia trachomatis]
MHFSNCLYQAFEDQLLPEPLYQKFQICYQTYIEAASKKCSAEKAEALCSQWLKVIIDDLKNPIIFPPYHKKIRSPIDLYQFGIDFFSALIDDQKSQILHPERLDQIQEYIQAGHNVVLLANHQTESDPQLMYCLLGASHPQLMESMIFVAGDRITSDPLARPFSMGCDLLCIYSKRHINHPPELKEEKLMHNQKSMRTLKMLLSEGRKFFYVAPSGGRDRKNLQGELYPAEFHPDSVEMFRLLAKSSGKTTHFFPLAMKTYDILPPPPTIEEAIGEHRVISFAPVAFNFGDELLLDELCSSEEADIHDKRALRALRASRAFSIVTDLYKEILT